MEDYYTPGPPPEAGHFVPDFISSHHVSAMSAAYAGDLRAAGGGRAKSKKEKRPAEPAAGFKSLAAPGGQPKKIGSDVKVTVLVLIDDEKMRPIEVELYCKTYPKEHEAFTAAFLRQNDFARHIFVGERGAHFQGPDGSGPLAPGVKLLKWYFQEDHLTFPRLCLIYQNRCSSGRSNPWVPKLIRNGPNLRGPVVLVQQKKSPNAETVVFDQYRRDDRHMLPAAASFLPSVPAVEVSLPRGGPARSTMRATAPPLVLKVFLLGFLAFTSCPF